jgi:hypothetical protein
MAGFMHKALLAYTAAAVAEHPFKYDVEQESDTPVEVTPKRRSLSR